MSEGRNRASLQEESQGDAGWIPVVGVSMLPTLTAGDRVMVTHGERLRFGDIAAFVTADRLLVVHRYIGHRKGAHRFLGDARTELDAPVKPDAVLGPVCRYLRDGIDHPMTTTWADRLRLGRRVAQLVLKRARSSRP